MTLTITYKRPPQPVAGSGGGGNDFVHFNHLGHPVRERMAIRPAAVSPDHIPQDAPSKPVEMNMGEHYTLQHGWRRGNIDAKGNFKPADNEPRACTYGGVPGYYENGKFTPRDSGSSKRPQSWHVMVRMLGIVINTSFAIRGDLDAFIHSLHCSHEVNPSVDFDVTVTEQ